MSNLNNGYHCTAPTIKLGQSSAQKGIGIVGARALPAEYKNQVSEVVKYLLSKGYTIHSGGALGTDQYALETLVSEGAVSKGVIFSAWTSANGFPKAVQKYIDYFISHRGKVHWGLVAPNSKRRYVVAGLLSRNGRLVRASHGLVAFLYGDSNGTKRTVFEACRRGIKVIVFLCGGGAELPKVYGGSWVQLECCEPWGGAYMYKK